MPIQTGFYQTNPLRSVTDYIGDMDAADLRKQQIQQNKLALASGQMGLEDKQRSVAEAAQLRNALASLGPNATHEDYIKAARSLGTQTGLTAGDALEKALLERQKTGAEVKNKEAATAQTAEETIGKRFSLYRDQLAMVQTPEQAAQWVTALHNDPVAGKIMGRIVPADKMLATIPQDPAGLQQWVQRGAMGMEKFTQNQTTIRGQDVQAETSRATNAATNERIRQEGILNRAAQRSANESGVQYVTTDQGIVAVPKKPGVGAITGTVVTGPDGAPLKKPSSLKDAPQSTVKAYTENQTALEKIDEAIAAVKENPDAFGLKNFAGDTVMQRVDKAGVSQRAKVSDIGSLKIHDRTGAAMAAAEAIRLKPFIPSATDTAETVLKKLEGLKKEYEENNSAMERYYSEESGFKPITKLKPNKPDNKPVESGTDLGGGFRVK